LYIVIQHYLNELFGLCLKFMNIMFCIYLNLRLKYVVKYLFLFFCKYPQISMDIRRY